MVNRSRILPDLKLRESASRWLGRILFLACLAPTVAHGHFLYVTTELKTETPTAVLFFSESAQVAGSHLPEKISQADAWWRDTQGSRRKLTLKPSNDRPTLEAPLPTSPGSLEASCTYGVYKSAFLLQYCSKHVTFETDAQLSQISRTPEFPVDAALQRKNNAIEVIAYRGNEPLAAVSVTWSDPSGASKEGLTNEHGVATFDLAGPGLYSARVHFIDKESKGEYDGHAYSETQYYTTASLMVSGAGLAPPTVPALPQPTSSFGAAVLNDWLYVYSGHTGKEHAHSKDNLSSHFIRCTLTAGESPSWEQLPISTPLQGLAMVSHQGQLYRIGGLSARNASGEPADLHSVADVERFDPKTKTWHSATGLPQARSSHDAMVLDGHLYVVGGWNLAGEREGDWLGDALRLDLSTPNANWESFAQPFRRRALAAAALDNKLYVIGGMDAEHNISRAVDIWDPATRSWSQGPELPGEGMQGFGVSAWTYDSTLYVSGSNGEVYKLRPGDLHWYRHTSLNVGRFFHRLLPVGSIGLIAVGGASVEQKSHLDGTEFIPFVVPKNLDATEDAHASK